MIESRLGTAKMSTADSPTGKAERYESLKEEILKGLSERQDSFNTSL